MQMQRQATMQQQQQSPMMIMQGPQVNQNQPIVMMPQQPVENLD